MNEFVPVLPESAPFTPEQRAYLNGFFAGIFSRIPMAGAAVVPPTPPHPLRALSILFGSQTGNCEKLAKRIAREAGKCGFAPTICDLAKYPTAQLALEKSLLLVTSTYGDGEPPDNARTFWQYLASETAPKLPELRFSLCALGDTNYANFCGFGKDVDARLEKLGATRVHPRADCDVEYEETFVTWLHGALGVLSDATRPLTPALSPSEGETRNHSQANRERETDNTSAVADIAGVARLLSPLPPGEGEGRGEEASTGIYSRKNPCPARLIINRSLNAPGSAKDVRHFELSLEGSTLDYEVGDALGVAPQNDPTLVAELIAALHATGDESVPGHNGSTLPLREALTRDYEITRIPKPLLEVFATQTGDELLGKVSAPDANGELTKYLWGRQIIDLLLAHPGVKLPAVELVKRLRKLQPRLYSISSSPKSHPGEVHLTVSALRYESLGRARAGVCSTFLSDRIAPGAPVPIFVHRNNAFRPPAPDVPLIMVGPGTGIAPFRAFLEERRAIAATGKNWLLFGDQKSTTDFLYREEVESFQRDGLLTRLDLAWSREQLEKVYVQHRMLGNAKEMFAWLEAGAGFYVCGDAQRMAKDVDAALHKVIELGGGKSAEKAAEYVVRLTAAKRYRRDVY